jgi:hypothetical protein
MLLYLQFLYRMKSFKNKIMNLLTAHPKLVTFGIGLAITFVIGAAIGVVDSGHNAFAALSYAGGGGGCLFYTSDAADD